MFGLCSIDSHLKGFVCAMAKPIRIPVEMRKRVVGLLLSALLAAAAVYAVKPKQGDVPAMAGTRAEPNRTFEDLIKKLGFGA